MIFAPSATAFRSFGTPTIDEPLDELAQSGTIGVRGQLGQASIIVLQQLFCYNNDYDSGEFSPSF